MAASPLQLANGHGLLDPLNTSRCRFSIIRQPPMSLRSSNSPSLRKPSATQPIFAIASLALTEVKNHDVLVIEICMLMACAGSGWGLGRFFEAPARSSQTNSQEERLQLDEIESSATDAADVSGPLRIMCSIDRLTNTLTGLAIAYV